MSSQRVSLQLVIVIIIGWAISSAISDTLSLSIGGAVAIQAGGDIGRIAIEVIHWFLFWVVAGSIWAVLQPISIKNLVTNIKWWGLVTTIGSWLAGALSAVVGGTVFGIWVDFGGGIAGIGIGMLFGGIGGLVLGITQWFVLQGQNSRAEVWILASTFGGVIGGVIDTLLINSIGNVIGGTTGGIVGETITKIIGWQFNIFGETVIGGLVNGAFTAIFPAIIWGFTLVQIQKYQKEPSLVRKNIPPQQTRT